MSRGGRGGFGMRGGLKGATWEHDATITLDSKPTELYPDYTVPFPPAPTQAEKQAIKNYTTLRQSIHNGPLYTAAPPRDPAALPKVFGEDQANEIFQEKGRTDIDPFVGVPTYTMKYEKKERVMPQLSGRPFIKEFFPQELWATLDGTDGHGGTVKGATRKKLILASGEGAEANASLEEKRKAIMEKIGEIAGEEGGADDEEAEGEAEEEEDYNYEDDEDEMGGDYDAEQYFDDGDGMDDDEGGGGGDDY